MCFIYVCREGGGVCADYWRQVEFSLSIMGEDQWSEWPKLRRSHECEFDVMGRPRCFMPCTLGT